MPMSLEPVSWDSNYHFGSNKLIPLSPEMLTEKGVHKILHSRKKGESKLIVCFNREFIKWRLNEFIYSILTSDNQDEVIQLLEECTSAIQQNCKD